MLEDVTKRKTGFCSKGQVYFLWDIKAKLAGGIRLDWLNSLHGMVLSINIMGLMQKHLITCIKSGHIELNDMNELINQSEKVREWYSSIRFVQEILVDFFLFI